MTPFLNSWILFYFFYPGNGPYTGAFSKGALLVRTQDRLVCFGRGCNEVGIFLEHLYSTGTNYGNTAFINCDAVCKILQQSGIINVM